MKKREISVAGKVANDGRLMMAMGEVNAFFKEHPNATVIARFIVAEPQSSEAIRGYYFNHIVPSFRQAIWESGDRKTEQQAEQFIREQSPIMWEETVNEETGEYGTRLREIRELSNAELVEHIETLRQLAAEEYQFYIEDTTLL